MRSKDVKVYCPPRFKPIWAKFVEICERDGTSASEQIRIWVEGQVRRRDPGNPQRPITSYTPGHQDHAAASRREVLELFAEVAGKRSGEVRYRDVVAELRSRGLKGRRLVDAAQDVAKDLKRRGVSVLF